MRGCLFPERAWREVKAGKLANYQVNDDHERFGERTNLVFKKHSDERRKWVGFSRGGRDEILLNCLGKTNRRESQQEKRRVNERKSAVNSWGAKSHPQCAGKKKGSGNSDEGNMLKREKGGGVGYEGPGTGEVSGTDTCERKGKRKGRGQMVGGEKKRCVKNEGVMSVDREKGDKSGENSDTPRTIWRRKQKRKEEHLSSEPRGSAIVGESDKYAGGGGEDIALYSKGGNFKMQIINKHFA